MLRMRKQDIDQGMTWLTKVYAKGGYVQCVNKA